MAPNNEIEDEIVEKGLTAPRITPQHIGDVISYSDYYRVANTTCTVCMIVLKNGYVVVGKSAAVSMENFDEEIGKKVAYENAKTQIWDLEGYLLKDKLHNK